MATEKKQIMLPTGATVMGEAIALAVAFVGVLRL